MRDENNFSQKEPTMDSEITREPDPIPCDVGQGPATEGPKEAVDRVFEENKGKLEDGVTMPPPNKPGFAGGANVLRAEMGEHVRKVRALMNHGEIYTGGPNVPQPGSTQTAECKANIMLAVRHLEDARMRLGKAIQAFEGGRSCLDGSHNGA